MQNKISNKLVEVVKAIRDEDGNPVFAEVVDYDDGVNKYQGYPAVMIVPRRRTIRIAAIFTDAGTSTSPYV